ncbi:amylovoran biosynthesis protein AmsF [Kalamiella sp. sgz302252]|uniref:amylovoran biosynthesis protein AmsF n=1 Tax=Pantoea sp. sgz302252 TaxID=3341827 RepID=UPI0036D29537
MIEVDSFAELRTTAPGKTGELAWLRRYHNNDSYYRGGGDFIGFITPSPPGDNSGTLAAGEGFYWRRIVNDPDEVNLSHFGARGDGITDDTLPVKNMLAWALAYNTAMRDIAVRFPAGRFLVSPIDISAAETPFFSLYGDHNPHGAIPRTTIISDQTASPVFRVKAQRITIQGIAWDGQASADTTAHQKAITSAECSNAQPFFENILVAGESILIDTFRAANCGGTVIRLLDMQAAKFNQIYTTNTYGRVFDVGYAGTAAKFWDCPMAIELSNASFLQGYADAILHMPRVSRGIINNLWIENCRFPGNLRDGQWILDALSVTACANPLDMTNSCLQLRQLNLQSGSELNLNYDEGSRWLSGYEYNWRKDENYGIALNGSINAGWYSGHRVTNNDSIDKWFKLGKINFPKDNLQWVFEIVGRSSTEALTKTANNPLFSAASCFTWLNVSRCWNGIYGDIQHKGSPSVLDVKINRIGMIYAEVFIKVKAHSGDTAFTLRATGPSRFESGECCFFQPALAEVADTNMLGTTTVNARMSLHNGLAGIGANEKGVLTIATANATAPSVTTAKGYVTVNINGTDRRIAYY